MEGEKEGRGHKKWVGSTKEWVGGEGAVSNSVVVGNPSIRL